MTEGRYDGVINAVKEVELSKLYTVEYLKSSEFRGYAIATKLVFHIKPKPGVIIVFSELGAGIPSQNASSSSDSD